MTNTHDSAVLRVGCLGVTHPHASARVKTLRMISGVEVVSAADEAPELKYFCEKYDLQPTRTDELLSDTSIEAVLIHSYSRDMVSLAQRALDAGKHVLVEKPGGTGVDDIQTLAAHETDRILQVGYNCRLAPSVMRAKKLLAAGAIGTVVSVEARAAAKAGEHLSDHLNHPEDIGGGLWIIGCHVLDIVLDLFGMPIDLNSRVRKLKGVSDERSREDSAAAVLNYPGFSVTYNFDVHDRLEWFETSRVTVYGTEGLIEIGVLPVALTTYSNGANGLLSKGWSRNVTTQFAVPWAREEDNQFSELPELSNLEFFETETQAFVNSIRKGQPIVVTIQDSLNVALVVQAMYDSSDKQGSPVALAGGVGG